MAVLLVLVGVSRQLRLQASEAEAASLKRQLAGYWPTFSAGGRAPQGLQHDQTTRVLEGAQARIVIGESAAGTAGTAGTAADTASAAVVAPVRQETSAGQGPSVAPVDEASEQALLQGDPLAQQVARLMRTGGMAQPTLSLGMMRQIHSELEKEVQRIKHQFELEAFQARSARFRPRIEDILRREFQLPPMLAALAWLESDFRLDAEGSEGKLGMWQLSEEVAAEYGLITEQGEDFRMDFEASTRGSARYLTDLLTRFGLEQLPLVVASFHLGTDVVENTIRQHKLWRHEQRTFPALLRLGSTGDAQTLSPEQLQYVSRFFAVQIIAENQAYYLSPARP
ncbi:MAG: transglycosylase SLT domain-containing protein [Myxococcota bacterium]